MKNKFLKLKNKKNLKFCFQKKNLKFCFSLIFIKNDNNKKFHNYNIIKIYLYIFIIINRIILIKIKN